MRACQKVRERSGGLLLLKPAKAQAEGSSAWCSADTYAQPMAYTVAAMGNNKRKESGRSHKCQRPATNGQQASQPAMCHGRHKGSKVGKRGKGQGEQARYV